MKKFLRTFLFYLLIPAIPGAVIAGLYIKQDVFYDFGTYNNYSWKYTFQRLGDLSTKKILNTPIAYNSFIFGSSRSVSIYGCYLQQKIPQSKFFHYANWNEPIGGIYAKLKLLDSLKYKLDNVIIYIDTDYTFDGDGKCVNDHYLLTNESKFDYYNNHFRDYVFSFELDKMKILFGSGVKGEIFPNWHSDRFTNDSQHQCNDSILMGYGNKKITPRDSLNIDSLVSSGFLFKRDSVQKYKEVQISSFEESILVKMKSILDKHHSRYYIVITPLYDQLKFNKSDEGKIVHTFGKNVYDFSGINNITDDQYNYPDRKHFRHYISKQILDSVIKENNH